ncbi:hypothetical protein [Phenylobacterium koreense]|uniref:Uncharacterized protein n=1 Tax=Phenylobacterium koreense TaxID=266125 RepID=A0ABV2EGL4_9CAUL
MQINEIAPEVGAISLRTLPGATGTAGLAVTGEQMLSLFVGVLTVIFLALQIAHLIWKWRRDTGPAR